MRIELIGEKKDCRFKEHLLARVPDADSYIATRTRMTAESILSKQIGICLSKIRAKMKKIKKNQHLIYCALLLLQKKLCKHSMKWNKNMSS